MGKWKEYKWGNLATLEYGKGLRDYLRTDGKYPVYGTNGKIGTADNFLCPFPGIVIGRKGAYRGVHFSSTPFYVIDTAFYLNPKVNDLDMKFAYYHLLTVDINYMDSGSAIPSTSREDFYDLDISLPSLPEQKSIASILSSLDDKIDLLHRQNKTLEALAETLFRQWFVEEAEEGWETGKLGDYAFVTTGKGLKRHEFIDNGIYPVLGANGEIGRTNNFLTDDRLILTGRVGTLGKVYISEDKVWISDNVLIVTPESIFFYPIYFILKRTEFENLNVGSTQPLVTQTDLKNIEFKLPSADILKSYEKQCSAYFEKISKNKVQIRTLTRLRDALLPKLMSGEVRVTDVERSVETAS